MLLRDSQMIENSWNGDAHDLLSRPIEILLLKDTHNV